MWHTEAQTYVTCSYMLHTVGGRLSKNVIKCSTGGALCCDLEQVYIAATRKDVNINIRVP